MTIFTGKCPIEPDFMSSTNVALFAIGGVDYEMNWFIALYNVMSRSRASGIEM